MTNLLLLAVLGQDAVVMAKKQPTVEAEPGVTRAVAVTFDFKSFDAKAARRWSAGYRRGIVWWDRQRVSIVFKQPEVHADGSVSWTGGVEGSRLPPSVTLVVKGGVVSGHFALDDGRQFDLVTKGRQVWLRQMAPVEMKEAKPRYN